MGAKTTLLAWSDRLPADVLSRGSELRRDAAIGLAERIFPSANAVDEAATLGDAHYVESDDVYVGVYGELAVIACRDLAVDRPSELARHLIVGGERRQVHLHLMHSVVDWFAYARWSGGQLERSLSLSGGDGVIFEDLGERADVEAPFWGGASRVETVEGEDEYPFPFHPLELGEAVLRSVWGFNIEGIVDPTAVDPYEIPIVRFDRSGPERTRLPASSRRRRWFGRR